MQVMVKVDESQADAERLQELTETLRGELLVLDVEDVQLVHDGEPPPGSRAVGLAVVGTFLVSVQGSVELVRRVVATVQSWLVAAPVSAALR